MTGNQAIEGGPETKKRPVAVSFEFFPPQSEDMDEALWRAVKRLEPVAPRFVSVTYGAGGSTRQRTHSTLQRILAETSLTPAAHLTCVGAERADVDDVVRDYAAAGIRHIVALRGDPTSGAGARYEPHPGGYANAADLVGGIRKIADFEISVAAYPEKHPESATFDVDIAMLQAKIDAGATRAITQFFFDNSTYFRFVDKVRAAGSTFRSCPAFCRSATSPGCSASRHDAGRRSHPNSRPGSRAWRIRKRGCWSGRGGGGAGERPGGPGRGRVPLLHAQPGRAGLCHMPSARTGQPGRQDRRIGDAIATASASPPVSGEEAVQHDEFRIRTFWFFLLQLCAPCGA